MSPLSTEDRLRHVLRGELDAVAVSAPATAEHDVLARARRQARTRQRRAAAAVGAVVLAGGVALGWAVHSDQREQVVITPATAPGAPVPAPVSTVTTVTTVPTTTGTTVPAPTATALGAPGGEFSIAVPEGEERTNRTIHVVASTTGRVVADLSLPFPYFSVDSTGHIEAADLTGDGESDYLVPYLAQGPVGVVVSRDGGEWRLVPFVGLDGTSTSVYSGLLPRIEGGTLTILSRSCDPSCAEGLTARRPWVYDGGVFRPAS